MNEDEIRGQAILDAIVSQRNEALNLVANLKGEIQVMRIKFTLLEEQLKGNTGGK